MKRVEFHENSFWDSNIIVLKLRWRGECVATHIDQWNTKIVNTSNNQFCIYIYIYIFFIINHHKKYANKPFLALRRPLPRNARSARSARALYVRSSITVLVLKQIGQCTCVISLIGQNTYWWSSVLVNLRMSFCVVGYSFYVLGNMRRYR